MVLSGRWQSRAIATREMQKRDDVLIVVFRGSFGNGQVIKIVRFHRTMHCRSLHILIVALRAIHQALDHILLANSAGSLAENAHARPRRSAAQFKSLAKLNERAPPCL